MARLLHERVGGYHSPSRGYAGKEQHHSALSLQRSASEVEEADVEQYRQQALILEVLSAKALIWIN